MKVSFCVFRSALARGLLAGALVAATLPAAAATSAAACRMTFAVTYSEGTSTSVDMIGSSVRPGLVGHADVKRKNGRTSVQLDLQSLPHPQSLGSLYTTYVLWAVAPEGQAASLAELAHSKSVHTEVTTSLQTFGLIVSAEPHSAVALPSLLIVAESTPREKTVGRFQTARLEYGGAAETLYSAADIGPRDFSTPLLVLGARRAVDLAKDAGADAYANDALRQAQAKLDMLEQAWPTKRRIPKDLEGIAREVMLTAEHARKVAGERRAEAGLAAERRTASAQVARARTEADCARDEALDAKQSAALEQARAAQAKGEAERAKTAEEQARVLAEKSRQDADAARVESERARLEAERARVQADAVQREKAELQQQLYKSLSAILETRREARGLIVSLSDVLFEFDRATLTPGAREKLSKLAGVLLAYPGHYRLEFEGHTDAIGTQEYNLSLSRARAETVASYLLVAGVPAGRIGTAVGYGKSRPVASNDNAAGRQMNRRVELVIADLDA